MFKFIGSAIASMGLVSVSFAGVLTNQKEKRQKPLKLTKQHIYDSIPLERDQASYYKCTFHNGLDLRRLDVDIKRCIVFFDKDSIGINTDIDTRGICSYNKVIYVGEKTIYLRK